MTAHSVSDDYAYAADLAQAERHVRLGGRHIKRQKEILARLGELGGDLRIATELLAQFESGLVQHIAHRDRIRQALAAREGCGNRAPAADGIAVDDGPDGL
jgi:hypothetical protein